MVILVIVVNDPSFFLSHRLPTAEGARDAGYEVHIVTAPGEKVEIIKDMGFKCHTIPLSRSGTNLMTEIRPVFCLWRLFRQIRPNIVHLVTIKPVLYGGIASRFAPVQGVVSAVSGLGFVFLSKGFKARIRRFLVRSLYLLSFGKKNIRVIFQNPDDKEEFLRMHLVSPKKVEMIRGSGVNLNHYKYVPELSGKPVVCFAARLLGDKGINEYLDAVKILAARGFDAHFQVIGDIDEGNPTTVSKRQLLIWRAEGLVEFLGHRSDISQLFAGAHVIVLPSYREGLPKVLIEAAACGRPVVTTDVPGCRDAIEPNVTGLLVPVKDAAALANAIQRLLESPEQRLQMGLAGRKLAEECFAIEKIVEQHMHIYRDLLAYGV